MVYPEDTFLWWGLLVPSFKAKAYVVEKQSDISKIPSVTGIMCAKCQNYNMCVIGLILLYVLESTKQTSLYQI